MKRREFLIKTSKAVALTAVSGATALFFHNRPVLSYEKPRLRSADFTIAQDKSLPGVVLVRDEDHTRALRRSLDAIGGIKRFVKSGERVTIKPNVGWDRAPAQAADTNPLLVGEMVRLCLEAGAASVIVADVTCNDPRRCFLRSGIKEAAEKAGATVHLEADEDFITVDLGGEMLTSWPVLKYFLETDRLINMPIVKQHSLPSCTIGLKNLYGILGGSRNRLHQKIDQSIVDLANFCHPTLTVVDATRVLLRGGPQGGSLDDVAIENTVICATDPVAADSRGAEFLGLRGEQVGHIVLAEKSGLGQVDYNLSGYKEIV
ncbi:MAG TPA: DUF362 domain-containing protein [candidate division Zixibacteria bacterium]|nr:DUF362 domain-containing protein [candidate division Zixibacteria bacterium]